MNVLDLEKKLISEGIPVDSYHLGSGLPNESYCLNFNDFQWEVYYSERGEKNNLKSFDDEDEACTYFYESLVDMLEGMGML